MLPKSSKVKVNETQFKRWIKAEFKDIELYGKENKSGVALFEHGRNSEVHYFIRKKGRKTQLERPDFNDAAVWNGVLQYCEETTRILQNRTLQSPVKPKESSQKRSADAQLLPPMESSEQAPPKKKVRVEDYGFFHSFGSGQNKFVGIHQ